MTAAATDLSFVDTNALLAELTRRSKATICIMIDTARAEEATRHLPRSPDRVAHSVDGVLDVTDRNRAITLYGLLVKRVSCDLVQRFAITVEEQLGQITSAGFTDVPFNPGAGGGS